MVKSRTTNNANRRRRAASKRNMSYTTFHENAVVGGLIGTINNPKTTKEGAERARAELRREHGISHPPKRKWTTNLKRLLHIGTGHRHSVTHSHRRY